MKLTVGSPAPEFIAFDQNGKEHRLSDYSGSWLVLYFYPRDNTPGCTKEACGVRDSYEELIQYASIVGVSADSMDSHKRFSEKFKLPFTLLADPNKEMLGSYGANGMIFVKRTTFIINPDGEISKIYEKVTPDDHAQELLNFFEEIA